MKHALPNSRASDTGHESGYLTALNRMSKMFAKIVASATLIQIPVSK